MAFSNADSPFSFFPPFSLFPPFRASNISLRAVKLPNSTCSSSRVGPFDLNHQISYGRGKATLKPNDPVIVLQCACLWMSRLVMQIKIMD